MHIFNCLIKINSQWEGCPGAGYWLLDARCWILDAGVCNLQVWNLEFGICDLD